MDGLKASLKDKAAALASYAKQSKDDRLMRMSVRIRDRAIRRAGEILKQIEPARGGDRKSSEYQSGCAPALISRKEAASEAGMSRDQMTTAIRVANVPAATFEAAVEAGLPAIVTQLAVTCPATIRLIIGVSFYRPPESLKNTRSTND